MPPPNEVDPPPVTAKAASDAVTKPAGAGSRCATRPMPIADPQSVTAPVSPPPVLLSCVTNPSEVPAFLRSHGKGNRRVDIFNCLYGDKDPHFQQVLFNYLKFEINDKSSENGSLPTANRPPEIVQWTSRARPASLPDFTKGNRTFSMFTNMIFTCWSSLQPAWRLFEWGQSPAKSRVIGRIFVPCASMGC